MDTKGDGGDGDDAVDAGEQCRLEDGEPEGVHDERLLVPK